VRALPSLVSQQLNRVWKNVGLTCSVCDSGDVDVSLIEYEDILHSRITNYVFFLIKQPLVDNDNGGICSALLQTGSFVDHKAMYMLLLEGRHLLSHISDILSQLCELLELL
jgi:hypothetical protein